MKLRLQTENWQSAKTKKLIEAHNKAVHEAATLRADAEKTMSAAVQAESGALAVQAVEEARALRFDCLKTEAALLTRYQDTVHPALREGYDDAFAKATEALEAARNIRLAEFEKLGIESTPGKLSAASRSRAELDAQAVIDELKVSRFSVGLQPHEVAARLEALQGQIVDEVSKM